MDADPLDSVARELLRARTSGALADAAPLAHALTSAADAYAVQRAVLAQLDPTVAGTPRHWKSGGPSREQPLTHAPLPSAGVWASPAIAGDWPLTWRGIEIEIALRLAAPVDASLASTLEPASVDHLIDAMAVSIEVVDYRWQQHNAAAHWLRLADFQSHGALVLGDWVPYRRRDWAAQTCRLRLGAQPELVRQGTHSLGDPAWLLPQWLRHSCTEYGTIAAGTVVTTGTWVGIVPAERGNKVVAVFDGIGEAELQL